MLPLNNFIFDKKYVFESNKTQKLRRKRTITVIIILIIVTYIIILSSIIFWGREEGIKTKENYFNSNPDLIAVYTGAANRIKFAVELSNKYSKAKIFISGIFSKTTLDYLSKIQQIPDDTNLNLIEADRWAKNTVENVLSTKQFLQKHTLHKNVIIVSHDYHILRIKTLTNKMINKKDFNINFVGIESDFTKFKNILILHKEVLKLIKAYFIVLFWDN